jgi:hypothetical protein
VPRRLATPEPVLETAAPSLMTCIWLIAALVLAAGAADAFVTVPLPLLVWHIPFWH